LGIADCGFEIDRVSRVIVIRRGHFTGETDLRGMAGSSHDPG